MRLLILSSIIILCLCLPLSMSMQESKELFQLDNGSYELLSSLFHDFSSIESIDDSSEMRLVREFPLLEVADIYRVYTKQQLDAMDQELLQHNHYIYDPIKTQVKKLRQESLKINNQFRESKDFIQYETEFIGIGQRLVSLQKLVLRIINSKIEKRSSSSSSLIGRTFSSDLFTQLSELLLGLRVTYLRQDAPSVVPTADAQLNWMDMMLRAMKRFGVSDKYVRERIERMERILDRVRQIYELNQLASRENSQINTEFISPYSYEATLRLVNLLGINSGNAIIENREAEKLTGKKPNAFFAPIMVLFRSFINLFSFGNLFSLMTRGFRPAQTPVSSTMVPIVTRYDRDSMKRLIQMLQDNQRLQQQQVGQNKMNDALKILLDNQNKQQQQINDILKALASNGQAQQQQQHQHQKAQQQQQQQQSISSSNNYYQKIQTNDVKGFQKVNTQQIMNDIREQRKKLNDLISELEKPVIKSTQRQNDEAQQNILGVMRKITPMINNLSCSGLISSSMMNQSRNRLLDILQSLNASNRETVEDIERMHKLGHALDIVLGDIILNAQKNIS